MISIADLTLKNAVALAPMSGVSDLPFRRAVARFGAGLVVSEMVASRELARARPDVVRRAEGDGQIFPFVVQLAGCDPYWMAKGAHLAETAGADVIDINMGCPSRQVTGIQSGSALMRDLDHAMTLIDATVAATSKPVTLKMRLGWDWKSVNASELARRAEGAGVQMITVHGRTRNDFYTGEADWNAVRAVKESVKIPLLVNGDIVDELSAGEALRQSGADGVMVGRAAIGRPWLPAKIAGAIKERPSPDEEAAAAIRHYRETIAHYGEPLGVRMARKHLAAYIDVAPVSLDPALRRSFRAGLCRLSSAARAADGLACLYLADHRRIEAIAA